MPDETITVHLDVDERYPEVLLIESDGGYYSVETTADSETVQRWRNAIVQFEAVQTEMMAHYRAAGGKG